MITQIKYNNKYYIIFRKIKRFLVGAMRITWNLTIHENMEYYLNPTTDIYSRLAFQHEPCEQQLNEKHLKVDT